MLTHELPTLQNTYAITKIQKKIEVTAYYVMTKKNNVNTDIWQNACRSITFILTQISHLKKFIEQIFNLILYKAHILNNFRSMIIVLVLLDLTAEKL